MNLFDTAEIYGTGRSKRILGKALGDDRDDVIVASKILPIAPFPPVVLRRQQGSADRLRLDKITAVPGAPAQSGGPDSVTMRGMRTFWTRAGSARPASPTIRWIAGARPMTPWTGRW